jgi:hypothetical protein
MPKHHTHSPSPGGSRDGHAHDSDGSHDYHHHLRQWASPSYDPNDGRSASSVDEQGSREHIWADNHSSPNRQLPREDSGFQARDRRCVQDRTPVRDRKLG